MRVSDTQIVPTMLDSPMATQYVRSIYPYWQRWASAVRKAVNVTSVRVQAWISEVKTPRGIDQRIESLIGYTFHCVLIVMNGY